MNEEIQRLELSNHVLDEVGNGLSALLGRKHGASPWELVMWLNDNGYLCEPSSKKEAHHEGRHRA